MPAAREISRRIKSVKSTKKITKAMQMVSAAKMRKSQSANNSARTYSGHAWNLLNRLAVKASAYPLLTSYPQAQKICVVVVSSNRGLVGSFNANLISEVWRLAREYSGVSLELVVLGKKAREGSARISAETIADFPKIDAVPTYESVYPLARFLIDRYATGEYREIMVVHNECISTLVQKVVRRRLFPLVIQPVPDDGYEPYDDSQMVLYEPTTDQIIQQLLPRIIESQLYQILLENEASEHSARMVMMKNATDAASDLADDLTLAYNQIRQSRITTELSEITAGKLALENKS